MNRRVLLSVLILAGLVLGVVVGQLMYDPTWDVSLPPDQHVHSQWLEVAEFLGFTVFMGLLKALIVPLIATSVVVAVTSVGDFRQLGRLGGWTLVYYFSTMLIAVVLGLVLVNLLQPGAHMNDLRTVTVSQGGSSLVDQSVLKEKAAGGVIGVFEHLVQLMLPQNIVKAMAEGQTLSIVTFCLFFGVIVASIGEQAKILAQFAEALFAVLMRMVEVVLWLAPVGVLALLVWTIARIGLGVFSESIGLYMLTVLAGLFIHALVVLPLILWIFGRTNPFRFMHQMREALLMAISTDSSSATLPVTIDCAITQGGVSKKTAGLVLPLGASINMDGTALYEAVAVVFMAQAFEIDLSMGQMAIIAITATLAAVGAAGIPSAGLVTMVIVLDVTNQSLLRSNPEAVIIPVTAIGLIIGVDRILDMARTTVNVWGDAVGAKIISRLDNCSRG